MKKYNSKMLKAIKIAAGKSTKTDGLRAIKRFERVNKIKFDPFNKLHVDTVTTCGEYEWFFRSIKKDLKSITDITDTNRHGRKPAWMLRSGQYVS